MYQKMKDRVLAGGAVVALALLLPGAAMAAGVTVSSDTTMSLPCFSAATLTIVGGSTATSFIVDNTTCTFTVSGASGDSFVVNASANVELNSLGAGNWSTVCQTGSTNTQLSFAPSGIETQIFTPANRSVSCGGSTGTTTGGGGGGGTVISGGVTPVPSVKTSTVAAAPTTVAANGTAASLVTITVKNSSGTALVGLTPQVSSSRANDVVTAEPGRGATDSNGVAIYKVTARVEGSTTITVVVESVVLGTATVTFKNPTADAPVVTEQEITPTGTTKITLSDGTSIERTLAEVIITIGTKIMNIPNGSAVRISSGTVSAFNLPAPTVFRTDGDTVKPYPDETVFWSHNPTCRKTWSTTCLALIYKVGKAAVISAAWPRQGAFVAYKSGTILSVKTGTKTRYYAISNKVYELSSATSTERAAAIAARPIMISVAFSYNGGDGGVVANTAAISGWSQ